MEENIIKYHQNKRRKHKIKLAIIATILLLIGMLLIGTYFNMTSKEYISYKENSEIKYDVKLSENEFYNEDYLYEGIDIIADIIESINVNFKYELELQEELEYKYDYKILAEIEVKEKSKTNSMYKQEEELINISEQEVKNNKLEIDETVNIDYIKYNDQITKLLDVYKITNTSSNLKINFYLNVIDKSTGEKINTEENVMTVEIPLTTKTVEITINESVKDKQNEILIGQNEYEYIEYVLVIGIVIVILSVITYIRLIKYILKTRSAEKMYDDEMKKILFDYKNYIQKTNDIIVEKGYKVIKIDSFKELIGLKEEIQAPILMYTSENERNTVFTIINGNILFEYVLDAKLIRERLIQESKKGKNNEKNK